MSSTPNPVSPGAQPSGKAQFSLVRVLVAVIVLAALIGVPGYFYLNSQYDTSDPDFIKAIRNVANVPLELDKEFTDKDGDLIADAPAADKQIDPETIFIGTLERTRGKEIWAGFLEFLGKQTGKKVEFVELPPGGQGTIELMKEGKLHVAALSTGSVPMAVNTAGFVPCVVPADENGNFAYQMEIFVRADSPIKELADLKGKKLTLTSMSSLSSFKAPVVTLWEQKGLRAGKDYQVQIGGGQEAIIIDLFDKRMPFEPIARAASADDEEEPKKQEKKAEAKSPQELVDHKGECEAIAVANDLFKRVVGGMKLDERKVRSVYKSESYPPFCIGYVYNLKPELAAKIKTALLEYKWDPKLTEEFARSNQRKFVAVDYKKDWEGVRKVDKALLDLVNKP